MVQKEIQEQRVRGYFLDSAKSILRSEGFRSFNVRNVADKAGYSYATLYNYFKDLRDLLYYCIIDFIEECKRFVLENQSKNKTVKEEIFSLSKAYVNYFVQYPATFELIFTERIVEITSQARACELVDNFFDEIFQNSWSKILDDSFEGNEKEEIKILHKHVLHSLLMFYLLRRRPESYKEFIKKVETALNAIFS